MPTSTQPSRQGTPRVSAAQTGRIAGLCIVTLLFWAANAGCRSNIPGPPRPTTHTVRNNADSGEGSLRDLLDKASRSPNDDVINFNLPSGSTTIKVQSPLPD